MSLVIFNWVLRASMTASILVGLILLIKTLFKKSLGARWQYIIWWILILRLMLPFTLPSPLSIFNLFNTTAANIKINSGQTLYDLGASVGEMFNPVNSIEPVITSQPDLNRNTVIKTANVQKPFHFTVQMFYLIWLSGLIALVSFFLIINIGFWSKIKRQQGITAPILNDLLREYRLKLGISRDLPIIQTEAVTSPALYGFIRPRLLMPVGIENVLDQDELGYIFMHELAHLKRKDILFNCILWSLQIIHWFNPIFWYAFRIIRLDLEIACDTLVLSVISPEERVNYGATIINLLRSFHKPARLAFLTGVLDSKTRIKSRIKAIANCGKHPYRWSLLAVIVLLITGFMVLTGAKTSNQIDASDVQIKEASLNQKVAQLMLNRYPILEDVIKIFGEPESYKYEDNTYSKENLPAYYMAVYSGFEIEFRHGIVTEFMFYKPDYVFKDSIRVGSTMEDVFRVLGKPRKTVAGRISLAFALDDGVLFTDIGGIKDYDSYRRSKERIRVIFKDNKVYALYLTINDPFENYLNKKWPEVITKINKYDDVRGKIIKADLTGQDDLVATLWFSQETTWPDSAKSLTKGNPKSLLNAAMNPGLGVRELHSQGITGKGVSVAIIDQPLYMDHPEFAGKIAAYQDMGCSSSKGSMTGPADTSILAGNNTGTAPDVKIYYVAAPTWLGDVAYLAKGLDWVVEQNRRLPKEQKIRVVSLAAVPSGVGSPFTKNNQMWDEACERAEQEGILVLDGTAHRGFIGPCSYSLDEPDDLNKCQPGFPNYDLGARLEGKILAPATPRTSAEEYVKGNFSYQYTGLGGFGWSIPYVEGVLALGWQVCPELTPAQIKELLFKSAYIKDDKYKIINPKAFIQSVKEFK